MSLRTIFNTVECYAYGFILPFAGAAIGMKTAMTAPEIIPNPMLAEIVTQNAVPAFATATGLYVVKLALDASTTAIPSARLAALASAGFIMFGVTADHLERGPFLTYVHDGHEAHYVIRPPEFD